MNKFSGRKLIKDNIYTTILLSLFWLACVIFLLTEETGTAIVFFADNRSYTLTLLAKNITLLGEHYPYIISTIIYSYFDIAKGLLTGFGGLFVLGAIYGLKTLFAHPRPKETMNLEDLWVDGWHVVSGINSFPSGHSAGGFAIATILALFINNKYVTFILFTIAILIAWTRIYLVQHYVKDVFAGSIVGILIGLIIVFLYQYINVKYKKGIKDFIN